jgi:hypothetical protein
MSISSKDEKWNQNLSNRIDTLHHPVDTTSNDSITVEALMSKDDNFNVW